MRTSARTRAGAAWRRRCCASACASCEPDARRAAHRGRPRGGAARRAHGGLTGGAAARAGAVRAARAADGIAAVKLYDAARCPFCARVRIVLAEKEIEYETVEIDLSDRPRWIYDLNPTGKVPVLDDGFVLPESAVIMEYLEERDPETPLLPGELAARAEARLKVFRFDDLLGGEWYAFRRGEPNDVERRLAEVPVGENLFLDAAFGPWVIRARYQYDLPLPARVTSWLDEVADRPAFAAE